MWNITINIYSRYNATVDVIVMYKREKRERTDRERQRKRERTDREREREKELIEREKERKN